MQRLFVGGALLFWVPVAFADPPVEVGEALFVCRVPFTQSKNLLSISNGVSFAHEEEGESLEWSVGVGFGVTDRLMLSASLPLSVSVAPQEVSQGLSNLRLEGIFRIYTNEARGVVFSGGMGLMAPTIQAQVGEEAYGVASYLTANKHFDAFRLSAALTGRATTADTREAEVAFGAFVPFERFAVTVENATVFGEAVSEVVSLGVLLQARANVQLGAALVTEISAEAISGGGVLSFAWEKQLGE